MKYPHSLRIPPPGFPESFPVETVLVVFAEGTLDEPEAAPRIITEADFWAVAARHLPDYGNRLSPWRHTYTSSLPRNVVLT